MEDKVKKKYKAVIKTNHRQYLDTLKKQSIVAPNFEERFSKLLKRCNNLVRKDVGSVRSVKLVPQISKIIFGLYEDMIRLSLPKYLFETEKTLINDFIIEWLKIRRETKYFGECQHYGEVLLNLYLDVLVVITTKDINRIIEHRPTYLVNPLTGQNLELDITLEGIKLSFELQGESHYRHSKEKVKDEFKIKKSVEEKKVLIPINLGQLQSEIISNLIANTLKEVLGLHDVLSNNGMRQKPLFQTKKWDVMQYKRTIQRMYLAEQWFSPSLEWIDRYATRFITTQKKWSPISTSINAPSMVGLTKNLSVNFIYKNIKNISICLAEHKF